MRTVLRVAGVLLVTGSSLFIAPRAGASCHSFTVSTNSPVTEGEKVKVTVTRSGNRDASSVQVQTSNKSAVAPSDYDSTITRVEFTDETSRTIEIATNEDDVREDTETFQIKVNSARGCRTVNTDYEYGPPTTVTISDDDGAKPATPEPTGEPTSKPTAKATSTPEATASGSPSAEPTDEPTASPEETAIALPTPAGDDDDGGVSPWLVAAAIGALVLAGAGALIASRLNRGV